MSDLPSWAAEGTARATMTARQPRTRLILRATELMTHLLLRRWNVPRSSSRGPRPWGRRGDEGGLAGVARRALRSRCRRHSRTFPEGLSTSLWKAEQRRPERPLVHADAQSRAGGHRAATALGAGRPLRQMLVDVHVDEGAV